MPRFSAFTPFGMLAFSSKRSFGESIYAAMRACVDQPFDMSVGTHEEAKIYAQAMGLARARYALLRARNQTVPSKTWDMLPVLEADYGLAPLPTDSLVARRGALAARVRLPGGARVSNVTAGLRDILGSNFLALRTTSLDEATSPSMAAANFRPRTLPPKFFRTLGSIAPLLPASAWVSYAPFGASPATELLMVGDVAVVQGENSGLAEKVTVTGVQAVDNVQQFQATFTKSHDTGATVTTMHWPFTSSTKRFSLVIVTATAAIDAEQRRKVDDFMARVSRGVSQWAIVQPTTPGALTVGPAKVDAAIIGAVPIGTFAFTLSP